MLVEGYTDVLALHQAGMRNCGRDHGHGADRGAGRRAGADGAAGVVLALDADSAGQEAMLRAARVAAGRKLELRVVPLPEGARSRRSWWRETGPTRVRALIDGSVPFVRFRVERVLAAADLASAEGKDRALAEICARCWRGCRRARCARSWCGGWPGGSSCRSTSWRR